jgi:linearmycin/streptolysin S transport system permease protein
MQTVLLIAAKDARLRLRDRSLFLFALVLPFGLAFILSRVLGGVTDGSDALRYAVVDQDAGPVAAGFTDQFLPAVQAGGAISVQPAGSVDEARQLVDDGEAAAAFIVPAGFSAAVQSGAPVTIEVIGDVDSPFGVQVAQALADAYTADIAAIRLSIAAAAANGTTVDQAVQERAAAIPNPVALVDATTSERTLDAATFTSAGMAVFFLFFAVQFGVSGLLEERAYGTMARLLAAPIRPIAIFGGKLLVSFAVGAVSLGLLVIATSALLGASWGDPVGVAVLVVTGALAATGLMALVGSLARTAEQASNWQSAVAVVLGTLGGAFFPVAQIGGVLGTISYLTPHRWFLQGLSDLAGGGGVGVVWQPALALLAFALAGGAVAVLRGPKLVQP